jgi:26S proteasome non-ATPase regulatory subunit 10
MVASLWGHIDTMKLLMEKGIDIFNKTNDNEDALMYACSNDQVETFEFLINLGFDPNVKDANSYSSLNHAIFFHSNNVIKYFLEHTDLFNDENKKLLNSIRLDYLF